MEQKAINPFHVGAEFLNYCIRMKYIEFSMEENRRVHYYLTPLGETELAERFGIRFDCPCADEKQ